LQYCRQVAFDARPFLDVVLGAVAAFGADDTEDANASIRVLGAVGGEEDLRGLAEH